MCTPDFGQHVHNPETAGKCYCHSLYGEQKMWGCKWFDVWKGLVQLAHYRKQRIQVFFFPGQVGQGKIKWDDCAEQALLRDKVMGAWPKDDAGWPKKMSAADEAEYVAGLSEKERHCVVGLGGSQKAEVAWLDAHGISYEELDVGAFSFQYLTLFQSERAAEAGSAAITPDVLQQSAGHEMHTNPMQTGNPRIRAHVHKWSHMRARGRRHYPGIISSVMCDGIQRDTQLRDLRLASCCVCKLWHWLVLVMVDIEEREAYSDEEDSEHSEDDGFEWTCSAMPKWEALLQRVLARGVHTKRGVIGHPAARKAEEMRRRK
jgi:hypothetical protein